MAAKGEGVDVSDDVDPALAAFAAWRESRRMPTVDHDAFGSTWQFPRSMPAQLWFFYQELRAAGRRINQLTYGELDDLAPMVVPADVLAEWCKLPATLDEFHSEVIRVVFMYLFPQPDTAEDGDASGEAETESTSATSSSPTSDSSSATSSASTASTSSKRSKKKG